MGWPGQRHDMTRLSLFHVVLGPAVQPAGKHDTTRKWDRAVTSTHSNVSCLSMLVSCRPGMHEWTCIGATYQHIRCYQICWCNQCNQNITWRWEVHFLYYIKAPVSTVVLRHLFTKKPLIFVWNQPAALDQILSLSPHHALSLCDWSSKPKPHLLVVHSLGG
jgi:hypothetical protein